MSRLIDRTLSLCTLPGRLVGWLVLPLVLFVCLTVFAAKYGINAFAQWNTYLPVLGRGITVNTLADAQWYIFALLTVFGGVYAYRDNRHVSVDFFTAGLSDRTRLILSLLGDVFLLLPFCAIIVWYGYFFALTAYTSGEGSTYGGLQNRWLIKACLPLGFGLLGIAAVARIVDSLLKLAGPAPANQDHDPS